MVPNGAIFKSLCHILAGPAGTADVNLQWPKMKPGMPTATTFVNSI
jgi:hypothetical protein